MTTQQINQQFGVQEKNMCVEYGNPAMMEVPGSEIDWDDSPGRPSHIEMVGNAPVVVFEDGDLL